MDILINKDFMLQETIKLLNTLYILPELLDIEIKGIIIPPKDNYKLLDSSINKCFHDIYSDVDIKINIKLSENDYNAKSPIYSVRMDRLGLDKDILGMSHYLTEDRGEVIRVCKANGMRFDLVIKTICADNATLLPMPNIYENTKIDKFWFIANQALVKLMRKDYLISSHLTHLLIQEGIVLQMKIRDTNKNTNFHRYGYAEELEYLNIFNSNTFKFTSDLDLTYNHIAKYLYSSIVSYDRLSTLSENFYKSRFNNFIDIWSYYWQNSLT